MKSLRKGWWIVLVTLVVSACQRQEESGPDGREEAAMAGAVAEAEEGESEAMSEEVGESTEGETADRPDMAEVEAAPGGEATAEEMPATPVVIYFKRAPSQEDLTWLGENGFVVRQVQGNRVSGHFDKNPPPEFKDDPRLDRIVPLMRPGGPS